MFIVSGMVWEAKIKLWVVIVSKWVKAEIDISIKIQRQPGAE